MTNRIAGPGVGLPLVPIYPFQPGQSYAPSVLAGQSLNPTTNEFTLAPGQALPMPAGEFIFDVGPQCVIQFLDPVTNIWRGFSSARVPINHYRSDGFNLRIANLTGCPVSAVVTSAGGSYAQATTTITASSGGSLWQPIIGGAVSPTVVLWSTVGSAGAGYSIPPICFIPAPPSPGVQATARAQITGGTLSSIIVTNQGAGYSTTPVITLLPNPTDPNYGTITNATATLSLVGAGSITAALCTNPGTSLTAFPTLTVAGAGTIGTVVACWMNAFTAATITATGGGFPTIGVAVQTVGGQPAVTPAWTNPDLELTNYIPRPAVVLVSSPGGTIGSVTATYDAGLFVTTGSSLALPQVIASAGGGSITVPTINMAYGGVPNTVKFQSQ